MVFTPEQDRFILMAHFRSGTLNEDGSWSYCLQSCMEQCRLEYPNVAFEYDVFVNHKSVLIKRFETKNCICKGKSTGRPTILTENVKDDIQQRMERSPNKSVSKLSAQTGLSVGTCDKALKTLDLFPYKVTVVQQLYPIDYQSRVRYCEWFNETLNNDLLDLTFFTDEAWFHLSGYVNSQNYRTWAAENPHVFIETSLHPIKIGVWIAMSRRRIIGPIFFYDTITGERYRRNILQHFIEEIHDDELRLGYFQQDGASPHTARATLEYLHQFYEDRLISRGLWPPRSPDLTPLDFFLFGHLKNNVFKTRLHTLDELREAIIREVNNITPGILENVYDNMKRRVNKCLERQGGHFQHFL